MLPTGLGNFKKELDKHIGKSRAGLQSECNCRTSRAPLGSDIIY